MEFNGVGMDPQVYDVGFPCQRAGEYQVLNDALRLNRGAGHSVREDAALGQSE